MLLLHPIIDILAYCILGNAVAFLDFAFELFALAGNFVEIVIRKMTPLLILPFNCFQLPSIRFQSIANSFRSKRAVTFGYGTVHPTQRSAPSSTTLGQSGP
jgi:hypothetical protein